MYYYTTLEVAEMLKVTESTVRRWVRDKRIKASIISNNKGIRITESAIKDFMESNDTSLKD